MTKATRTRATVDIVITKDETGAWCIYAQDYNVNERGAGEARMPAPVALNLDAKHIRKFHSMGAFTEWLFEESAVVDQCWII